MRVIFVISIYPSVWKLNTAKRLIAGLVIPQNKLYYLQTALRLRAEGGCFWAESALKDVYFNFKNIMMRLVREFIVANTVMKCRL